MNPDASMRPRLLHRGKAGINAVEFLDYLIASMRPRLLHRGKAERG